MSGQLFYLSKTNLIIRIQNSVYYYTIVLEIFRIRGFLFQIDFKIDFRNLFTNVPP